MFPAMVVDAWVNLFPEGFAESWSARRENAGVGDLFGEDLAQGRTVESLVTAMDDAGGDVGVRRDGRPRVRDGAATHGARGGMPVRWRDKWFCTWHGI